MDNHNNELNEYNNHGSDRNSDGNKNGRNDKNGGNGSGKKKNGQTILAFIMFTLIAMLIMSLFSSHFNQMSSKETTYTEFITQLEAGNVKTVEFDTYEIDYTLVKDDAKHDITYYTGYIADESLIEDLKAMETSEGEKVQVKAKVPDDTSTILLNILSLVVPLLGFWIILGFLMRRMGGGAMGVGKSTAKVYVEKKTGVTFKNVAGQDEAKESLQEMVDFLHNPDKYKEK